MIQLNLAFRQTWIVYDLECPEGRHYVGLTRNSLEQRLRGHERDAPRRRYPLIGQAITKFGLGLFKVRVLEYCHSLDAASATEQGWVAKLHSFGGGYNATPGGIKYVRLRCKQGHVLAEVGRGRDGSCIVCFEERSRHHSREFQRRRRQDPAYRLKQRDLQRAIRRRKREAA